MNFLSRISNCIFAEEWLRYHGGRKWSMALCISKVNTQGGVPSCFSLSSFKKGFALSLHLTSVVQLKCPLLCPETDFLPLQKEWTFCVCVFWDEQITHMIWSLPLTCICANIGRHICSLHQTVSKRQEKRGLAPASYFFFDDALMIFAWLCPG